MPNDAPDWVRVILNQLAGRGPAFTPLGDVTSPALSADSPSETITSTGGPILQGVGVLASFKAAAGLVVAVVGALGAVAQGSNTSVSPTFGQATTSGNFLLAWVTAGTGEPTTAQAGWAKVIDSQAGGSQWAALWAKPNCGAAETAPTFTSANGSTPMHAQLAEFSGVATASPTDQTGSASGTSGTLNPVATAADVAFGDLVAFCTRWALSNPATATFSQTMNNGASPVHAGDSGATSQVRQSSFNYAIVPAAISAQPLGVADWAYDATGTNAPAGAAQASVVLAAKAGKAYTCAAIVAALGQNGATAGVVYLDILDGAVTIWTVVMAVPGVAGNFAVLDLSGLAIKGTVGNSMTLQFRNGLTGVFETVAIGAYLR